MKIILIKSISQAVTFILVLLVFTACKEQTTNEPANEFTVVPYDPLAVTKSNTLKVYAHYMPWFESQEVNGYWGIHWTMANCNPEIKDSTGRRQIASHFYPLIGPYSSVDKDLVEYHLLLMKLAGIDGILIDWYGSWNVLDYQQNRLNSEAIIEGLDDAGLDFGVVYEDYTAEKVADHGLADTPIAAAQGDIQYLAANYFSSPQYIQIKNAPLLLTFGPRYFLTEGDWTQIFATSNPKPHFLTLWNQSNTAGTNGNGEFAWVYRNNLTDLNNFYNNRMPVLETTIGSAYPGFYDYYTEGGWNDQAINFSIRYDDGATLSQTLDLAAQAGIPMLQLVTWNDFGEGTMLEPTIEYGFLFLEKVQQFTGVSYDKADLELILQMYQYRKQFPDDTLRQLKMNQVFYYLVSLQLDKARELLATIE